MKMSKRFMSAALAAVMAMTVAVPAFASEIKSTSSNATVQATASNATVSVGKTDIASVYRAPAVKVVLPGTVTVVSNPYELKISAEGNATDQIYCPELQIVNEGECAVSINVKAAVKLGDALTLVSKPIFQNTKVSTTKDVYAFVEFSANHAKDAVATFTNTYPSDKTQQERFILPSGKYDRPTEITKPIKLNTTGDDQAVSFKLQGELNGQAEEQWATTDTIEAQITFEIMPTVIN